ncbi:helix-turn-helix transcriptional regulator, partial [Arthrobacter ginkgonis]|uniref:helix-turn-helix transcriptional regulator n=1 Tax=Arthrobacter ginkgonis TaxID=1630594 RepID=UPI0031E718CC
PRQNLPRTTEDQRIGLTIQRLRELHGISQEQLAQAIDVGRATLAHYERGTRRLSYERIQHIAWALHEPAEAIALRPALEHAA